MAELKQDTVSRFKLLSVSEFAQSVGGVLNNAINYAMIEDKVDYIKVGRNRIVVMTEKTKSYTPNNSPKRP